MEVIDIFKDVTIELRKHKINYMEAALDCTNDERKANWEGMARGIQTAIDVICSNYKG